MNSRRKIIEFKSTYKTRTICTLLAVCMLFLNIFCLPCYASSYIYYTNKNTPNYITTNLNKLYCSSGSYSSTSWYNRIYSEGCFVTSYAMILKNLGNTTSSRVVDVRSSLTTTAYLEADPFTVTYANAGFPSITYNSTSGKYIASYSSDPVFTTPTTIANNFDATYSTVDLSGKTDAQKAHNLAYYINKYPQGVGIYFSDSSNCTHLIVGVASTYPLSRSTEDIVMPITITDSTKCPVDDPSTFAAVRFFNGSLDSRAVATDMTYGAYFTVCDPVSYYGTSGDNVLMNACWTATTFDFSDIQGLRIFK